MCLAIPARILEIVDERCELAQVDVGGVRRTVNVSLLGTGLQGAGPGDWVLVHVGFAIAKVDEREAEATLALLEQMGEAYEAELAELRGSAIE